MEIEEDWKMSTCLSTREKIQIEFLKKFVKILKFFNEKSTRKDKRKKESSRDDCDGKGSRRFARNPPKSAKLYRVSLRVGLSVLLCIFDMLGPLTFLPTATIISSSFTFSFLRFYEKRIQKV